MKTVLFIFILVFLFPFNGNSQIFQNSDSLADYIRPVPSVIKPRIHYSLGSNFIYIPRYGVISGFNASAFYFFPVTPKLSFETGLLTGRYYSSLKNINPENRISNSFNTLSFYGTASYRIGERFTVYGTGIKQIAGQMPYYNMPASSFTLGSEINFGNFSIGASVQMSDWNNLYSPYRYGGNPDYYSAFPW